MEWKEDALKAAIVAFLGFIGHYFLKLGKKTIAPVKKIFNDVNKIDQVETEQHYISTLLQSVIHVLPHPMFIMDADGNLEYVNPAWCEMTGFRDPDDAYGMGYMRAIPDAETEMMTKRNENYTKHPSNFEGVINFRHIYTGAEFSRYCRTELIYDKNKKVIKTIGILY